MKAVGFIACMGFAMPVYADVTVVDASAQFIHVQEISPGFALTMDVTAEVPVEVQGDVVIVE